MTTLYPLALKFTDIVPYPQWQIPALILLIAIIIGWVMYRRKQM